MKVKLVSCTSEPLRTIEECAAICYNSKPTRSGRIMKECVRNQHLSVLEHVNFTFHIYGVSRALMAQLTRHRIGTAFSIRSQRYVKEDNFRYVTPASITVHDENKKIYDETMQKITECYITLVESGVPAEDARYILPNACETEIGCTMNLRELMHFCNERMCMRAQGEIREMAIKMAAEVVRIFPETTDMLVPKCEMHEIPFCTEIRNPCGRHKTLEKLVGQLE